MKRNSFQPGDRVVCCVTKRSAKPGPRAKNVRPDPHGEGYTYQVDKLWLVEEKAGSTIVLRTRRGKRHTINETSHVLRHPRLIERLLYASRFPQAAS